MAQDTAAPGGKTLHLHIGAPKTGTSAIQAFLALNREAFLEATGILYPESMSDSRALKGKPTAGNGATIARFLKAKTRDGFSQAMELIDRELDAPQSQILLSSEGFWAATPERMQALVTALEGRATLKVLFYVRPQVRHIESAYLQVLGNRGFDGGVAEYFEAQRPKFMMGAKLRNLRNVAGSQNVTLRKYDRKALVGGDVVDDFLDVFGAPWGPQFRRPAEINTSLDSEHYLYARMVPSDAARQSLGKRVMRGIHSDPAMAALYARAPGITGLQVMDPETAERVYETYQADNEALDALAPEANLNFNEANRLAVEALQAGRSQPPAGMTRLELLLLNRMVHLEAVVADLYRSQGDGGVAGVGAAGGDED